MEKKQITQILIIVLLLTFFPQSIKSSHLEIFSWWTADGEKEGLDTIFEFYTRYNPGIEIINATVTGGAGINAKAALKTRMVQENPPDSFQVHAGSELIDTWVKAKYLKPISDLWTAENWYEVYPDELIKMVSYQGEVYSVPLNIHRSNLLWYNKKIFDSLQLSPPQNLIDFVEVAHVLKNAGITPLALGSKYKWPISHLFESILASHGADFYRDLISGSLSWKDQRVKDSLAILDTILTYTSKDHGNLSWDEACRLVLNGQAAMTVMGTWSLGYFRANGGIPEKDFSAIPFFNTEDIFIMVIDSFGLPRSVPHPQNATEWLKIIGSREVQLKASLQLGSIPARNDLVLDEFDPISKQNKIDFYSSSRLPSIVHGSAIVNAFVSALNDELAIFINTHDIEETTSRLEKKANILGARDPLSNNLVTDTTVHTPRLELTLCLYPHRRLTLK
jgi:glucose/mannose transport system substrate-binding protein